MIGILAYGSLICKPGEEIDSLVVKRLPVTTPFPIEFGRYSQKRASAPTVVPVTNGGRKVKAQILVLRDGTTLQHAKDILWRRETNQVGSGTRYTPRYARRAVRIREIPDYHSVSTVLYTDFYASTKIRRPNPINLARKAIKSVGSAENERDGISYLIMLRKAGVKTPLSRRYESEILKQTGSSSLEDALKKCRQK